jgi:hypothetical protein
MEIGNPHNLLVKTMQKCIPLLNLFREDQINMKLRTTYPESEEDVDEFQDSYTFSLDDNTESVYSIE